VRSQVQICLLQPSLAPIPDDDTSVVSKQSNASSRPVPAFTAMSDAAAAKALPPMLLMHYSFSVELSSDPGGVQQMSLHLSHQFTCLSVGHFAPPIPQTQGPGALLSMPGHGDRGEAVLCHLHFVHSAGDRQPCLIEHFMLYVSSG
jgi:hypothetical protein